MQWAERNPLALEDLVQTFPKYNRKAKGIMAQAYAITQHDVTKTLPLIAQGMDCHDLPLYLHSSLICDLVSILLWFEEIGAVLVIHGRSDRILPFGNGVNILDGLRSGQRRKSQLIREWWMGDGVGHFFWIQCMSETSTKVNAFLKDVDDSKRDEEPTSNSQKGKESVMSKL